MSKSEFLDVLRKELKALPPEDVDESLNFYSEMIDDRMDEGLSEEDAVASVGSVREIAAQIFADAETVKSSASERGQGDKRSRKAPSKKSVDDWKIILLALGSPIWLPLLLSASSVILALVAVLWSLVVTVWAVFAGLCGGLLGGIAAGVVLLCTAHVFAGLGLMGAGLLCGGLAIFLFFGCLAATKGAARLTKAVSVGLARCTVAIFSGIFACEKEA